MNIFSKVYIVEVINYYITRGDTMNMEKTIIDLAEHEKELCFGSKLTLKEQTFLIDELKIISDDIYNLSIQDIEYLICDFIRKIAKETIIENLKGVKNQNASEILIKEISNGAPKDLIKTIINYYDDCEIYNAFDEAIFYYM